MSTAGGENPCVQTEARCARAWLALALGVLVFAGLFSLVVVIGRMPPFDRLVTDPLFFKRGLVAHVNLALVAWFYSFLAALLFLLPVRREAGWISRHSVHLSAAGVAMMLLAAGMPGAQPVLSNYIPMIDHWLFGAGQLTFGAGVLASFAGRLLLPRREQRPSFFPLPGAADAGLRAAAFALLLATVTLLISWLKLPPGVSTQVHYELLVWGTGHVLQLACSVAMVAVWIALLSSALGRSPVSPPAAKLLFAAMVAPWLFSPLLAVQGSWTASYRVGFTQLMQWSIFPVVSIFLVLCFAALHRAWREERIDVGALADPRISGFLVSAGLTLLGFGLGASIRGSNTMVPAHYHASIGGVTVAFMTITYVLLGAFGFSISTPRLRRAAAWQPLVYGVGQMIFAGGFAVAGAHGMSRKTYGAEQASRGFAESIGLGIMGMGGLLAVGGGLLFLGVVYVIWRRGSLAQPQSQPQSQPQHSQHEAPLTEDTWRYQWAREIRIASIRSRS
jgi:cytochrome c oxidase subunit 1